jgi:hypothetical protein
VADPGVDSRPVVIDAKSGGLARLEGRILQPVKYVKGLEVPGANRPAMSGDSSSYAVLNGDRSKLLLQLPGTKKATVVTSTELSAPSFDPQGWVWTASGVVDGAVYAIRTDSGAAEVKAPWLKPYEVVSLRISRDGARAVIAAQYHGVAHLFLSGVIRDAEGRPMELTKPLGLVPDLTSVTDVAWQSEDQVVLLGERSSTPGPGIWLVQVGGINKALAPVPDAESITAGNGVLALLAGTPKGTEERSGGTWDRISTARWPSFPG